MIKEAVYSAENIKFYMYFDYIQEKITFYSNIMFVGLEELLAHVFV